MSSEMKIEIPTQLIEDTIRAELIRQIGDENKEELIRSIVKQAMEQKKDYYHQSPTYFQEAVNDMIREEALEIFRLWLEKNRADIALAMRKYMTDNNQEMLTKFCESIAGNIRKYGIDVKLNFSDRED